MSLLYGERLIRKGVSSPLHDTFLGDPQLSIDWPDLIHATQGLNRGEVMLVAGSPSSGKTSFLSLLLEVSHDSTFLFLSRAEELLNIQSRTHLPVRSRVGLSQSLAIDRLEEKIKARERDLYTRCRIVLIDDPLLEREQMKEIKEWALKTDRFVCLTTQASTEASDNPNLWRQEIGLNRAHIDHLILLLFNEEERVPETECMIAQGIRRTGNVFPLL